MSTCFDVYVLPSGCDVIYAYPSAVHPRPPRPSGGPKGGTDRYRWRDYRKPINDDEEIALLIGLGYIP